MSKQHEKVKALRSMRKWEPASDARDVIDWAIRVCEAADNLVNVKGRHHAELAYKRLDEAVNS